MKEYVYSLFDKNGKVISPELFSKAVYYSIWYGKTLKIDKEPLPPFKSREKQEFILDHVNYINETRLKAVKKRKTTQSKHEKLAKILLEELKEEIKRTNKLQKEKEKRKEEALGREIIQKQLDKKTKIKSLLDFEIKENFKVLKSSSKQLNTFIAKFFHFKFKEPIHVDPNNSEQLDFAIEALRALYREAFPIAYNEANKRDIKQFDNTFIVKIMIPQFDEKGQVIRDNIIKSFPIWSERKAIEYAKKNKNVDIVVKKMYMKKKKQYEERLCIMRRKTEQEFNYETNFDFSAISTTRFSVWDIDEDNFAYDIFEELLDSLKKKAVEYLVRAYAVSGAIAGITIEYIYDFNISTDINQNNLTMHI